MDAPELLEALFSYGSLQRPSVQLATFGRLLSGASDALPGYRAVRIEIVDKSATAASGVEAYLNAHYSGVPGDVLEGTRFGVTPEELAQADVYEASARYRRIRVHLSSGLTAWMYVSAASLLPTDDAGAHR